MVTSDRDEYIINNLGLVHSVAKRFLNRGTDYDDLFQAGCVGLIKAVDNFDETKGFAFSTYAVPVIIGEIKRIFRDGGAIKISRSLKEISFRVQKAREAFISEYFREPLVSELCEICSLSAEVIAQALDAVSPVKSLYNDEDELIDIPFDDSDVLFDRITINEAKEKLSELERSIIDLRYFNGKTQTETAEKLGLSQVQVSRKERNILIKLREYMK